MLAAHNGHLDLVKCIFTEYSDVIDINAKNNVSTFDWYLIS